jgi:hypothetical protein
MTASSSMTETPSDQPSIKRSFRDLSDAEFADIEKASALARVGWTGSFGWDELLLSQRVLIVISGRGRDEDFSSPRTDPTTQHCGSVSDRRLWLISPNARMPRRLKRAARHFRLMPSRDGAIHSALRLASRWFRRRLATVFHRDGQTISRRRRRSKAATCQLSDRSQ